MFNNLEKKRREALKLKREMDEITAQHLNFLSIAEAEEKRRRNMGQAKAKDSMFKKRNDRFDELENKAYENYYNHMHSEFDINNSQIDFLSPKYKDKFCDTKYINDMYNLKKKQQREDKKQRKIAKRESKANARKPRTTKTSNKTKAVNK